MKEIKLKKYPVLVIFDATRFDLKLTKEKEKKLKEMIKEGREIRQQMEDLFKKGVKK